MLLCVDWLLVPMTLQTRYIFSFIRLYMWAETVLNCMYCMNLCAFECDEYTVKKNSSFIFGKKSYSVAYYHKTKEITRCRQDMRGLVQKKSSSLALKCYILWYTCSPNFRVTLVKSDFDSHDKTSLILVNSPEWQKYR